MLKQLKPLKWTTTVCSLAEAQSEMQLPMFQIPGSVLQQFYAMDTHLKIQVIVEQASQQKPASQDLIELINVVCLTTQLGSKLYLFFSILNNVVYGNISNHMDFCCP